MTEYVAVKREYIARVLANCDDIEELSTLPVGTETMGVNMLGLNKIKKCADKIKKICEDMFEECKTKGADDEKSN